YVYTAPTGKGLAQTKLKGNDETGWLTAGGAPITADEDNEDVGIEEGDILTQKQILAVYGDLKMIGTEKVAGANIYNNTDNLIQVDKNNIKQEVYNQVSAIGTKTQVKRYVATVKVFKTPKAKEGKKGKHVIVKMILNPDEYKVVFK
ncbi:MAG: hypothetical protein KAU20_00750, partial [Nanoarchaeota archaeon]|nr:hypothetical protein [Nanoarchaeota archaeon]